MENDNLKGSLLCKMTETDFAATDLSLYLDTHPDDENALKAYNQAVALSKEIRQEYEKHFGPITGGRCFNNSSQHWEWADNPWPWQGKFNKGIF